MNTKKLISNYIVIWLFFVLLFSACNSTSNGDQEQDVAEKTVVDTELMDSLINEVQQVLVSNLSRTIDEKGIEEAALFCSNQAQFLTDSVSKHVGYSIRRLSDKNRNPLNRLSTYEEEVMLAFAKSKESGDLLYSQVDEVKQVYYKPILLGMPICLKCHGNLNERDASAYAVIQSVYPDDYAVDYSLGDLRGMWAVDFSSK